jgi:hypothetical protein
MEFREKLCITFRMPRIELWVPGVFRHKNLNRPILNYGKLDSEINLP